jgi:hypothetical protein
MGHPEILQRQDVLLSGIYHALADIRQALAPGKEPMPEYAPLSMDYLSDAHAAVLLGDADRLF